MTAYKPARFRRFLAFVLDFFLTLLCIVLIGIIGARFSTSETAEMALTLLMLVPFSLFVCRDFLLNGRSIGKRIMGLAVVDCESGAPAGSKQLAVKALFLFLYFFDGLFLLFSGRSIAERATNTAVIRSRQSSGPLSVKRWLAVMAVTLGIILAFCALITFSMNAARDADGYQPALRYLTSSDAFAGLSADAEDVDMTGFSFSTRYENGETVSIQSFQFRVRDKIFSVTCHPDENGTWQVCDECTEFE